MKLKRLFTAVLSTALALSLCAMPAMADSSTTTAGTPLADGMRLLHKEKIQVQQPLYG